MQADVFFQWANSAALLSWVGLALLPRRPWVVQTIRGVVITSLCLLYAVLVFVYFFRVEGGGFFSLQAVQRLFTSPHVALAGWVHYLAFDLLIGTIIAQRCAALGLSRLLETPLLLVTFMFGPIGWLLLEGVAAAREVSQRQSGFARPTLGGAS